MQIEIKINGEAAELQDVLRALLTSSTAQATEAQPKPTKAKSSKAVFDERTASVAEIVEHALSEGAQIMSYTIGGYHQPSPETKVEAPEPQPSPETKVEAPEPQPSPEAIKEPQTTISFKQVRAAIGAAALKNKDAVKLLLKEFGATKTSELDPKHYETIMQDLTRIK